MVLALHGHASLGTLNGMCIVVQEAPSKAGLGPAAQMERAAEKGLPERPQERMTLGGALPEGLRTALGLSAGEPVGQLQSVMEKGQRGTGLLAAASATMAVATATVPTALAGAKLALFLQMQIQ